MIVSCKDCPPAKCLIKHCSDQSLNLLNLNKSFTRYKKGDFIFGEGSPVYGIFIIFSGKVKVFNTGINEKKQVVRLAGDGHLIGHRALGGKYYSVSAIALEDTLLCFIETKIFTHILRNDAELTYQLMLFYADELRNAEARMKNLGQMTVREKVAEALLIVKKIFGTEKENRTFLDVLLNRNDLAEIAGIRTDQLIRTLSEFRNEKIISLQNKKIEILNSEKLFKLISPFYPLESSRENQYNIS